MLANCHMIAGESHDRGVRTGRVCQRKQLQTSVYGWPGIPMLRRSPPSYSTRSSNISLSIIRRALDCRYGCANRGHGIGHPRGRFALPPRHGSASGGQRATNGRTAVNDCRAVRHDGRLSANAFEHHAFFGSGDSPLRTFWFPANKRGTARSLRNTSVFYGEGDVKQV